MAPDMSYFHVTSDGCIDEDPNYYLITFANDTLPDENCGFQLETWGGCPTIEAKKGFIGCSEQQIIDNNCGVTYACKAGTECVCKCSEPADEIYRTVDLVVSWTGTGSYANMSLLVLDNLAITFDMSASDFVVAQTSVSSLDCTVVFLNTLQVDYYAFVANLTEWDSALGQVSMNAFIVEESDQTTPNIEIDSAGQSLPSVTLLLLVALRL
jgi:hypothetical protein